MLLDSPEGAVVEVRKGKEAARASEGITGHQVVLDYTMADWEAWKEAVPARQCLLPVSRAEVGSVLSAADAVLGRLSG